MEFETSVKRVTLTIPGRLPNLNDYTKANRTSPIVGNKMKQNEEDRIAVCILEQLHGAKFEGMVYLHFRWIEANRNRDPDNICFAKKFILDALVKNEVIQTDGWRGVYGFTDEFDVDAFDPRVEVVIEGKMKGDKNVTE
jgi:hypothetical protein